MSAIDLAAVILSTTALGAAVVLTAMVFRLKATLAAANRVLTEIQATSVDTMAALDARVETMDADLRRVDGLLDTAEQVSARADTLSRVTYGAVAKPVIKTAAVVKGTSRAARRLRRGASAILDEDDSPGTGPVEETG